MLGALLCVYSKLRAQTDWSWVSNTWVTSDFVGQWIHAPGLFCSLSIMLTTEIEDLVPEGFIAVPAMARENATIFQRRGAPVDSDNGDVVWPVT